MDIYRYLELFREGRAGRALPAPVRGGRRVRRAQAAGAGVHGGAGERRAHRALPRGSPGAGHPEAQRGGERPDTVELQVQGVPQGGRRGRLQGDDPPPRRRGAVPGGQVLHARGLQRAVLLGPGRLGGRALRAGRRLRAGGRRLGGARLGHGPRARVGPPGRPGAAAPGARPAPQLAAVLAHLAECAEEEGLSAAGSGSTRCPIACRSPTSRRATRRTSGAWRPPPSRWRPPSASWTTPPTRPSACSPCRFPPRGNAVVYGSAGSGAEQVASAALCSLLEAHGPEDLNVYIVDLGSEALGAFRGAPQVGDVVLSGDAEKAATCSRCCARRPPRAGGRLGRFGGDRLAPARGHRREDALHPRGGGGLRAVLRDLRALHAGPDGALARRRALRHLVPRDRRPRQRGSLPGAAQLQAEARARDGLARRVPGRARVAAGARFLRRGGRGALSRWGRICSRSRGHALPTGTRASTKPFATFANP